MRDHFDDFVHRGGNAAIFSANSIFWQVRFEPSDIAPRTMVCFKDGGEDPVKDETATVKWHEAPVDRPSNRSIGLGFEIPAPLVCEDDVVLCEGGGGAFGSFPTDAEDDPFIVKHGTSWVFSGTGLGDDAVFGSEIVGYETDSLVFNTLTDLPTGRDQAPNNFQILARTDQLLWKSSPDYDDHIDGWAILGTFDYGGTVFNAGTVDWAAALTDEFADAEKAEAADFVIEKITENVLTRLSAARTARQRNTMSVHRYFAPAVGGGVKFHFSTSPFVESGWQYDGLAFYAHPAPESGAVPVYQYYASEGGGYRYYYSRSATVASGWTLEGEAFRAYATAASDRVPVYEYFAAQSGGGFRFLFSTDPGIASGWTRSSVVPFYAPIEVPESGAGLMLAAGVVGMSWIGRKDPR